jgi:hypothetical protein
MIAPPPHGFGSDHGRLWESGNSSITTLETACPAQYWLKMLMGQGYIDGWIGSPECSGWPRCPEESLTLVLEVPSPDGQEAYLRVLRTVETPTQPDVFDFTKGLSPPGVIATVLYPPFPQITVLDLFVDAGTIVAQLEFDDLVPNFYGVGPFPHVALPPSSTVQSWDLLTYVGVADPGRARELWFHEASIPYTDIPVLLDAFYFACSPSHDVFLALGVTFHGGAGPPVASRYVSASIPLEPDVDGDGVNDCHDSCLDADGDGYGQGSCLGPDCDDGNEHVYPGAPQVCDGVNNDCDFNWPHLDGTNEADDDGDGYSECDGDCDDGDEHVYSGAPQICDGVNNDCDSNWPHLDGTNEADDDGDGYSEGGDCDDSDPNNWGSCGTCSDDDQDGYHSYCDAYVTIEGPDNCPEVYNPSQKDSDDNGIGDACETPPKLHVSCDIPADFSTVQGAVDQASQSGTTIQLYPCTYEENVVVDRDMQLRFVGESGSRQGVVVGAMTGTAFDLASTGGGASMRFEGLTLRGDTGIRSDVPTHLEDLYFEFISVTALSLDAGAHEAVGISMGSGVVDGVHVAGGASLSLDRSRFEGLGGTALQADGAASVVNTQITQCSQGVIVGNTGNLDLHYATIVDQTGTGVDNTAGGEVTIASSVAYGNSGGDLVSLPCTAVAWSLIGAPDCSGVGDNLPPQDPGLDPDYRLTASSPCLDHGPEPSTYTGWPRTDGGGECRLRDHDGDGMAYSDCGAYERENPDLTAPEVLNLHWILNWIMTWDLDPLALEYHIYRGDLAGLSYGQFGVCRDDLDPDVRTDQWLTDGSTPLPGEGYFYLVTAEEAGGDEGTLGFATNVERSNYSPCP